MPARDRRVFRRNGLLFQLRNLDRMGSLERLCASAMELDDVSFLQMTSKRNTAGIVRGACLERGAEL